MQFFCERRVPILIILRSITEYGIVCVGGGEERQTENLKEMRGRAVLTGDII